MIDKLKFQKLNFFEIFNNNLVNHVCSPPEQKKEAFRSIRYGLFSANNDNGRVSR